MLKGRKIILGVSGSIAAYKAALITRLLVKAGAEVKIVMSEAALDFITPLTLATLSKHPVWSQFKKDTTGEWNNHVELGLWADALLVAPATAHTLAKCAQGICDNLLTSVYLSAKCPVFFAPAMDRDMYQHPSTKQNLEHLIGYGNYVIDADHGELASGLVGVGRMAEPEKIVKILDQFFQPSGPLAGKKVMITAGPTHEIIDPIRFIGNHSSGKMGFALAEAMAQLGAAVSLVSGPSQQQTVHSNIKVLPVVSAHEMYEQANAIFPQCDIAIFAAAVADYTPKIKQSKKIKKKETWLNLELVKTKDIAKELSKLKTQDQITVGFALETDQEEANALKKLKEKNLDIIVLNSLRDKGAGFQYDTNKISIIDHNQNVESFDLKTKSAVAQDIADKIVSLLHV